MKEVGDRKMRGILKVLMLKHLVVRMRRFISTAVELISPAVFFILLYVFKDYINQPVHMYTQNSVNVYKPVSLLIIILMLC